MTEKYNEEQPIGGCATTPLLLLLDGVLSRDEERVKDAVREIAQLLHPLQPPITTTTTNDCSSSSFGEPPSSSPCCMSQAALCDILSNLLEHHPELARMRSEHDGSLPLHFAASLGDVQVASIIFSKYPQAASVRNQKGKIPLHYAAREGRVEMVHYFLQVSPDTVAMATNKGKLALHFAAGDGHEALTSILLRLYPQGAAWPSSKGKLPLHFCARWGYVDIAHDLLRIYPDAVRTLDWDGSLPLHDAAREGQCRMSRYLIERFPTALQTANLRGEIPLFAAVRSAKVDLVALMIQAWPKGGQHILRTLSADDNVTNWKWDIVELLLRGAVNNLEGCKLLEGREPPTVRLTDDMQPAAMISSSTEEWKAQKKMKKDRQSENDQQSPLVDARRQWTPLTAVAPPFASLSTTYPFTPRSPTAPSFAFMPVRSKSPILTSGDCNGDSKKKHARKRMRQSRAHVDSPSNDYVRKFIALHAAFECKAACHVIEHVLREHSKDVVMKDELGRLPLHWAVTHCHNQDAVATTLVLKNRAILTPEAACTEDSTGKLPLHLAIASRADVRVICALLEAYPAAGVEPCRTKDCFHAKTPVHMATYYDCDLSTVFELLRVDPSFVSRH